MSDVSPYGVTQNPDAESVTANAMVGERAGLTTGDQMAGVSAATMFSTAPYKKPGAVTAPKGVCADPKCRGLAKVGSDYCRWHQK